METLLSFAALFLVLSGLLLPARNALRSKAEPLLRRAR
jgi:hypothetical protein